MKKLNIKISIFRSLQIIFGIFGSALIVIGLSFIPTIVESNKIIENDIRVENTDEWIFVDIHSKISTKNFEFMEELPIKFEISITTKGPEVTWQNHYVRIYIKSEPGISSEGIPFEYISPIAEKQWLYPEDTSLSFSNDLPMDGEYYVYAELYDQPKLGGDGELIDSKRSETFNVYSKEEIYMERNEMSNKATLSIALFVGGPTFLGLVIGLQGLIVKDKSKMEIKKEKKQLKREKLRKR